jgi:hypothetical protein
VHVEGEFDLVKRKSAASAYAKGLSSVLSKMEPEEVLECAAKALTIKGMILYQNIIFVLT